MHQVPRLVFANACFSSVTTSQNEQRGQLVGLAQAFFARGIPNYIGTAWQVDDATARECARWFYARVLGLRHPANGDGVIGMAPPATIGDSLKRARNAVLDLENDSSSWGAYQHYGRVTDKLLPIPNALVSQRPSERGEVGRNTGQITQGVFDDAPPPPPLQEPTLRPLRPRSRRHRGSSFDVRPARGQRGMVGSIRYRKCDDTCQRTSKWKGALLVAARSERWGQPQSARLHNTHPRSQRWWGSQA